MHNIIKTKRSLELTTGYQTSPIMPVIKSSLDASDTVMRLSEQQFELIYRFRTLQ